jgi:hypothetical protein
MGSRLDTLNLGRVGDGNVHLLFNPQNAADRTDLSQKLNNLPDDLGLEFVFQWGGTRTAMLVLWPVYSSLSFVIGWLVYQSHIGGLIDNTSRQTSLQTAFTVASYIVTTSSFPI